MATLTVERMPGEPIIIATVKGKGTAEHLREIFRRTVEIAQDIEGPIYRIDDFSKATTSMDELLKMAREIHKSASGSAGDSRLTVFVVSKAMIAQLGVDLIRKTSEIDLMLFKTLDQALEFARLRLNGGKPEE